MMHSAEIERIPWMQFKEPTDGVKSKIFLKFVKSENVTNIFF
jgi:hypothetical protein